MKKNFLVIVLITLLLIGCSPVTTPAQPNVETIVAGTLQALTAGPVAQPEIASTTEPAVSNEPAPTAISGIPVNFGKISFVIPEGIALSATEEKVEAVPAGEGVPWWGAYPAHAQYPLQGYALTSGFQTIQIYVYPIAEYVAMNEEVGKGIEVLKSLIANPSQPVPERLPFLPTFNAGQMFHSNFSALNFQNGSGIRYVTEFSQFPHPISNSGMIYTFQGITNDGLYYVSAILPINIGFLVGYPTPTDQGNFEEIEKQVELVTQQLNNSSPESFTPSMLKLDALIQSITVTGLP